MHTAAHNGKWVVRLVDGEELIASLLSLPLRSAVVVCGIGMLRDTELGFWNGEAYETVRADGPHELLTLQGNLGGAADARVLHLHVGLGKKDTSVCGGHLVRATVHNTAELLIEELPGIELDRRKERGGLLGLYPREA